MDWLWARTGTGAFGMEAGGRGCVGLVWKRLRGSRDLTVRLALL